MKFLGSLFIALSFLISWSIYIGLGIYAIYYIVTIFIDEGVLLGFISIPIAGLLFGLTYLIVSMVVIMPLTWLAGLFMNGKKQELKIPEEEQEIIRAYWKERDMYAGPNTEAKEREIQQRLYGFKVLIEKGFSPDEADKKARAMERHARFAQARKGVKSE